MRPQPPDPTPEEIEETKARNMTTQTKERPILFLSPMVRAILDGRKTQTRRVVKAKDSDPTRCITLPTLMGNVAEWREQDGKWFGLDGFETLVHAECPYGSVGSRLWVRETWRIGSPFIDTKLSDWNYPDDELGDYIHYKVDDLHQDEMKGQYRPSIHMPRWASRITLEITGVRVERLQEISEKDCFAEGCQEDFDSLTAVRDYRNLWQSINGPDSWDTNPWVWVIEFRRV